MARVSDAFLKQYSPMNESELKDPIVFVVDMNHGFITEGTLHDPKIMDITEPIANLLEGRTYRSVFIADSHPPKTREFLSYPQHCVIGTRESEVIEELQPYIDELMRKNSTNTFTCPDFQIFLKERIRDYRDIIITGCCTDICILQFALSLNAWLNEHNETDKRVILPINCIDTFHIDDAHDAGSINEFSIRNMESNGICMVSEIERG